MVTGVLLRPGTFERRPPATDRHAHTHTDSDSDSDSDTHTHAHTHTTHATTTETAHYDWSGCTSNCAWSQGLES